MHPLSTLRFLLICLFLLLRSAAEAGPLATEFIYPNFTTANAYDIDNGGAFLASKNGAFKAAVFNPGKQQVRFYLSVLHAPSGTLVWSANRNAPTTSSGHVQLSAQGITVSDPNGTVLWSTPPLKSPVKALRLLDTGNLQLLDAANTSLWHSFDDFTDTLLPGQQLASGAYLSSSRSDTDLSEGEYRLGVTGVDAILTWLGSKYWQLSNDMRSFKDSNAAVASMSVNASGLFLLAADVSVVFTVALPQAEFRVAKLSVDGRLRIMSYALVNSSSPLGGGDFVAPSSDCDLPHLCPSLGLCSTVGNSSSCTCPPQFAESASQASACTPGDGAALASAASCRSNSNASPSYVGLKAGIAYFATKFDPPTTSGGNDTACRGLCSANCSCLGYFYDSSSLRCYLLQQRQLGSLYWSNLATALGYIKTFSSPSKTGDNNTDSSSSAHSVAIILPSIASFLLVIVIAAIAYVWWRRRSKKSKTKKSKTSAMKDIYHGRGKSPSRDTANTDSDDNESDEILIPGFPTRFSYAEIEAMTANFQTKIGSGGFGAVYKGELPDSKALVAVKKIEAVGVQGKREFCTEIAVIGNIRHVNLVRLRGFCVQGSHRLLVYEYMNRGSLDRSLFGRTGPVLEWGERMEVALGAARGLAYLHTGCDQKIVHCDVKPENILLADGGQVKIGDFGLAKLMSPEQSALFTTMRGTRGYLAPEWLSNAAISDRADVYSFGMVLLELIHGRKNRNEKANNVSVVGGGDQSDWPSGFTGTTMSSGSSRGGGNEYFPMLALERHEEGKYLELADPRLEGRVEEAEVARAVRIALCCLHEEPALRPGMAAVVRMLEGSVQPGEPRVEALGFLRLYGRVYAVPASLTVMVDVSTSVGGGANYAGLVSSTSSTTGGSRSHVSSQDVSGPR